MKHFERDESEAFLANWLIKLGIKRKWWWELASFCKTDGSWIKIMIKLKILFDVCFYRKMKFYLYIAFIVYQNISIIRNNLNHLISNKCKNKEEHHNL